MAKKDRFQNGQNYQEGDSDNQDFGHWLELCDFCGDEFGVSEMELVGAKFICRKCLRDNQNLLNRRIKD